MTSRTSQDFRCLVASEREADEAWRGPYYAGAMETAARAGRLTAAIQIALIDLKYGDVAGADETLRKALSEIGVVPVEPRETEAIAHARRIKAMEADNAG